MCGIGHQYLTGRYTGSSDTAIKQDYDQVKDWLHNEGKVPDVVKEAGNRIDEMNLRNVDRGALYKSHIKSNDP